MATGDLVTADWMGEFRGVPFGDGTEYPIVSVEGLEEIPGIRSSDVPYLNRHGYHAGEDWLGARTITLTIELYDPTDAGFAAQIHEISQAFKPIEASTLVMQVPGFADGAKFQTEARVRRRTAPINVSWYYNIPVIVIELVAVDPRLYSNSESSGTSSLATAGGGLTFDATPDFTFGAVSTGGSILARNSGTFATPVTFRIDGPCTNPVIENITSDKSLSFDIDISSGDFLLVDTATRSVLLNGTASRYSTIDQTSEWFDLEPGTSEIRFRASTSSAAQLTATWRSAFI